jgi:hypothetical protein
MCQYLYAAFSLKRTEAEGLSADETAKVQSWRNRISHVATQEMLHLSLVQNLLSAVGGAPHLSRPNFPQPASAYPAGVHLGLLPFGEQTLRHFMFLERPEGMDINDADGMAAFGRARPAMQAGDIVPRGQDFQTVGHLYRSIEAGIAHLADKIGADRLFVGPPRAQATQQSFGWPELIAVTDAASAQRAIDEILEQGEGPRGHWQDAHFGQFVQILDEYIELSAVNPAFNPVRPVVPVNVRRAERDLDIPRVTDPVTRRVMDNALPQLAGPVRGRKPLAGPARSRRTGERHKSDILSWCALCERDTPETPVISECSLNRHLSHRGGQDWMRDVSGGGYGACGMRVTSWFGSRGAARRRKVPDSKFWR